MVLFGSFYRFCYGANFSIFCTSYRTVRLPIKLPTDTHICIFLPFCIFNAFATASANWSFWLGALQNLQRQNIELNITKTSATQIFAISLRSKKNGAVCRGQHKLVWRSKPQGLGLPSFSDLLSAANLRLWKSNFRETPTKYQCILIAHMDSQRMTPKNNWTIPMSIIHAERL